MNISFSILWFDDSEDFFDSLNLKPLKDSIKKLGFKPDIDCITNRDDFKSHESFSAFDLIVVDYNLEEHGYGENFIKKIRDHHIYTEIIFYSASSVDNLWSAISKKKLEGVFVTNRQNIITKIERVTKQSVRKILDLDNMRGLVMAEVGDIDLILDEAILAGFNALPDEKKTEVCSNFSSRYKSKLNKDAKSLDKLEKSPDIGDVLKLCDSNKRWNLINSIIKKLPNSESMRPKGDYSADVLRPRNFLAHASPSKQDDGSYKFADREGKSYTYNETISIDLRTKITEYKKKFEKIRSKLSIPRQEDS